MIDRNTLRPLLTRPFDPVVEAARGYTLAKLRGDVMAGLTVAVVAVPQSMAYALIAEVPPQYGLYTVIFQSIIAALFNSNPFLSVGPINTQSLLTASIATRLIDPGNVELYVPLVISLTLLKGVMQLGLAVGGLGHMVRYVSQSVIVGFTAGAGVLIAAGQMQYFLGLTVQRTADDLPALLGIVQRLLPRLGDVHPWAVAIGLLSLAAVLIARRISEAAPGPLLAMVLGAAVVYALKLTDGRLALVGELPAGLPGFAVPHIDQWRQFEALLAGAAALSLLGLMEAYSIGKSLAVKTGRSISANRELFSQGMTNFLTSFLQCIPGSGSFSRSALNQFAGARTTFSNAFNGLFVAVIFLLFAPAARYVPLAALAAILFVIAASLIDWRYLRRVIRTNRADTAVCIGTFAATLVVPLSYAVFVGIFLNLALYLHRASHLHIAEMVRTSAGPFVERPIRASRGDQNVIFLQIEGDLFFAVADELDETLAAIEAGGAKIVIMRLKRTHSLDATVMLVLERFTRRLQQRGGHVILCGVRPLLMNLLESFGLLDAIGRDNVFEAGYGVFTSAKRAIERARKLAADSLDISGLDLGDETEAWAYEI